MPKVSVIIPVYNVYEYLKRCLDSVANQTLEDIEIICINDCSNDNSLEILKEYASKNKNINIINLSQNHGAAFARNKGLEIAKGKFIGFVDGDDFIDSDFYEKLYTRALETQADIVKGAYKYNTSNKISTNSNIDIKEDKNNFSYGFSSAIYRSNLINDNNIRFPLLIDMEDPVFAYKAAIKANCVEVVDNCYVNVTVRSDSQTAGIPSLARIMDKFLGLTEILDTANNSNISEKSYSYTLAFWINLIFYHSITNKDIETRNFIADKLFELMKYVKYKNSIINQMSEQNDFLAKILDNNKKDSIIHYEQAIKIHYIREKFKNG